MAGAGVRVFQAGEVLTATLVNTYLQDQVVARFLDDDARDAAFIGSGAPTLEEGRVCYLDSTNELQYYSGSAWVPINSEAVISQIQAKGDLVVGTGLNTLAPVAVGANDTILFADSSTPTGVAWKALTIGAGSITNDMLVGSVALSKLATVTDGQVLLGTTTTGVVTATTVSGDVTIAGDGVTAIGTGVIVDADVNAYAAIAHSKLANATAGQILLGTTTTGVVTATTISGDVTITGAGVTAIGSGVIVDADVNASAAISRGKIADMSIENKTANHPLVLADANKLIEMELTGTANTVSVPTNASVPFPIGTQINIVQYGTGKTQIVAVTPLTTSIRSTPGSYLRDRYSSATLIKRATDEWYLIGDLSAS